MRRIDLMFTLALALGLCATPISFGQGKSPKDKAPDSKADTERRIYPVADLIRKLPDLEEALANALKNNPDIRVAESKVHEAEAELNRSRLQVTQKVVSLMRNLETQQKTVEISVEQHRLCLQRMERGQAQAPDVAQAEVLVQTNKAKLAEMEADLAYLTGKQSPEAKRHADASVEKAVSFLNTHQSQIAIQTLNSSIQRYVNQQVATPLDGQNADKIRKALDSLISYESEGLSLGEALRNLEKLGGVTFLVNIKDADLPPVSRFRFTNQPLGAVLQAFEDIIPGLRFTVRDYGILVTLKTQAPEDAIRLREFWKALSPKEKEKSKEEDASKEKKH